MSDSIGELNLCGRSTSYFYFFGHFETMGCMGMTGRYSMYVIGRAGYRFKKDAEMLVITSLSRSLDHSHFFLCNAPPPARSTSRLTANLALPTAIFAWPTPGETYTRMESTPLVQPLYQNITHRHDASRTNRLHAFSPTDNCFLPFTSLSRSSIDERKFTGPPKKKHYQRLFPSRPLKFSWIWSQRDQHCVLE